MKAAEWRKRIWDVGLAAWPEELLRDFEAAEAENERLRQEASRKHYERRHRKRNLQALVRLWRAFDGALDAVHRLEDRCVAAEEERNAAEVRAQTEEAEAKKFVQETVRLVTLNDKLRENELHLIARAQAEQQRREAAEARVRVLDPALDAALLYRSAHDHKAIIGRRDKEEADKAIQKALCAGPHEDYVPTGPAALSPQERGEEGA
jgi:hypothetical protein